MRLCASARPLRLGLLLTTAFLLAPVTSAAQVVDSTVLRLDSLQVTVIRTAQELARTPFSVSVVSRSDIQGARLTVGLDEALAAVPGVVVSNRQNFALGSRITIRGFGARAAFGVRGVRVLADGIPLTMPDGQSNLNNVDLGSAGSIQVLRGPASALHGNAAGGVVAISTQLAPQSFSGEARLSLSDAGRSDLTRLLKAQAKVGQTVGNFDYVASVSRMNTDGFRDYSRAEQTVFNTRAGYLATPTTRLTLTLNVADAPVAQNPGSLPHDSMQLRPTMAWPRNVATRSGEATRQAQIGLRALHRAREASADVSVYALTRSLENPLPFAYIQLDRRAGGVRALGDRRFGSGAMSIGMDAEAQRDERREFANSGGTASGAPRRDQIDRVASLAPFAQARLTRGAIGLTIGGRYDIFRFETEDLRAVTPDQSGQRTMSAPSFALGATLTRAATTVFANAASAFQTPTTTELLNAPPAPGEPCCPAGFNDELDPQRALSMEIGARTVAAGVAVDGAIYWMAVRDALVPFQVAGAEGREFFRNAGRTSHRGIELSATRAIGALDVAASYAYTDVRFEDDGIASADFEDNRVPGIPLYRFFGSARVNVGHWRGTLEVQRQGAQYVDDANTSRADGFSLLALRLETTLPIGNLAVAPWAAVENLLDARYAGSVTVNAAAARFYEPAPGRTLQLGASVRTGDWRNR